MRPSPPSSARRDAPTPEPPSPIAAAKSPRPRSGASDQVLQRLGEELRAAWRTLLRPLGSETPGPTVLARSWELEQTLCVRLIQGVREAGPLDVLRKLPATSGQRTVLRAATERGADPSEVAAVERALSKLEALVARTGRNKAGLDILVARHDAHARERIERNAKQQVFRGMSTLLGVQAAVSVVQVHVFPSAVEDGWCDELVVHGFHRLLRLRPELPVVLGVRETVVADDEQPTSELRALHGEGIDPDGRATALKEFCSDPFPSVELRVEGGKLLYLLESQLEGLPEEQDVFFASIERQAEPRRATPEHPRAPCVFVPHTPSKLVVFDVYVHEELWRGAEPELILLRTGDPRAPDLRAHSLDRIDFIERLQPLGYDRSALASPDFDRLGALVDGVRARMGWEEQRFRLYRCTVKHPAPGVWYSVQFPLPG